MYISWKRTDTHSLFLSLSLTHTHTRTLADWAGWISARAEIAPIRVVPPWQRPGILFGCVCDNIVFAMMLSSWEFRVWHCVGANIAPIRVVPHWERSSIFFGWCIMRSWRHRVRDDIEYVDVRDDIEFMVLFSSWEYWVRACIYTPLSVIASTHHMYEMILSSWEYWVRECMYALLIRSALPNDTHWMYESILSSW